MDTFHDLSPLCKLSSRELAVLRLMGLHYGPTEIARNLGVRRKTVETYQARLRAKFQLSTTREVRHLAVRCYMAGLFRAPQGKLVRR
jgi:DNA-binding CsgD family transcriptional regulator